MLAAVQAERTAYETLALKNARLIQKQATNIREKPLVDILATSGYMSLGDRLLKKTITSIFARKNPLMNELQLSQSSSRGAIVTALIQRAALGILSIN